ncbi:MAG: hypothetical protein HQK49_17350 [Oligoflexia bacterium]|nr:hypothetical protein [Oligoflexia bacterium]
MEISDKQLEDATEKIILITFHHPPADVGPKHSWKERKEFMLKLVPVLKKFKNKISSILVGHEHVATFVDFDGIPLFVSPSSVKPRTGKYYNEFIPELGVNVVSKWVYNDNKNRYWLKTDIDTDNDSLIFNYINIQNNISECSVLIKANSRISSKENRYLLQNNCRENSL